MADAKTDLFQNLSFQIPEEVITEIYEQAWNEALAEARQLLKQKMLQSILDQALLMTPEMPSRGSLPAGTLPAQQPALTSVQPALEQQQTAETSDKKPVDLPVQAAVNRPEAQTTSPEKSAADLEAEALKAEIEAIRQKLLQNNQTLQQIKTPPAAAKEPEIIAQPQAALKVVSPDDLGYYVYCVKANSPSSQPLPFLARNPKLKPLSCTPLPPAASARFILTT